VWRVEELRDLAAETPRRYAYASALSQCARGHQMRLGPERVRPPAEEAIAIAQEYGFTYHDAAGHVLLGRARGIGRAQRGCARNDPPRPRVARGDRRAGAQDATRRALDDALALVAQSGAPFFYEAELHRLYAETLRDLNTEPARSEAMARDALRIAEAQRSPALALRARRHAHRDTARPRCRPARRRRDRASPARRVH
jgi:hypothetical protein